MSRTTQEQLANATYDTPLLVNLLWGATVKMLRSYCTARKIPIKPWYAKPDLIGVITKHLSVDK